VAVFLSPDIHQPHEGLEHQVEHAGFSQLAAAIGALVLLEVVGPKPGAAGLAVHQGIGELLAMAAGYQTCGFIRMEASSPTTSSPLVYHGFPPGFLHVVLQFRAERAVVPTAPGSSIDFRSTER
jgi:hypothetical protein